MKFGKRFSIHNKPVAPQQICKRCQGTCRVRERGNSIICRVCVGTGKVEAAAKRAS